MKCFHNLRMLYKILLPVSMTLVLVFGILAWKIETKGSQIVQTVAERELVILAEKYGNDVRSFIDAPLNLSIELAKLLAYLDEDGQPLSRKQIIGMLSLSRISDVIVSGSVALLPAPDDAMYKNTPGSGTNGRFIPYVSADGVQFFPNIIAQPHFLIPQRTLKPYISAPYNWVETSGKNVLMCSLAGPIIVNNEFKGITLLDISLDLMAEYMNDLKLYTTGKASVITQEGLFLTHQNPDLVLENVLEFDRWRNNNDLRNAMEAGQPYMTLAMDRDGENVYYFSPFVFPQTGQIMYIVSTIPVDELLADVAQLTSVTLMISVIALIVLLIVIFISVRSAIKPLAYIVDDVKRVSRGDFTITPNAAVFGGELLELNDSLTIMLESLIENINKAEAMSKDAQEQTAKAQVAMKEADDARIAAEGAKREGMLAAASQLEGVVAIISTASQQLSVQIEQSEQGFNIQASRVAETATAMEEMNSTVLEVASNASAASEMSMQTRAKAEAGSQIVQSAVSGIQRVQNVSLALKEDMNILATQADSISTIMDVISSIADQTNLLALNAAIEAARAGDAGRGFAVVADEVRKLAEKTMISTTDVGNAIKSIQKSVATSIHQVDQTVELIASTTEESTQSGIALGEIVTLVDNTVGQVQAIATASEEQSATSEEITRSMTEINEIAVNSAQTMRESARAVNDLAIQAQALDRLIEEMKKG